MAQHARPLPSPRTPGLTIHPSTTDAPPAPRAGTAAPPAAPPAAPEPRAAALPETPPPAPTETPAAGSPALAVSVEPAAGERPWYRAEPWLAVLVAAFVPLLVAVVAPAALRLPLVAAGGVLVAVGLALLLRRDRAVRRPS
jgi:Meckel syndrome type 1 protein